MTKHRFLTCLMKVNIPPCEPKRFSRNFDVSMPTLLEATVLGEPGTARRAPPSAAWSGCISFIWGIWSMGGGGG